MSNSVDRCKIHAFFLAASTMILMQGGRWESAVSSKLWCVMQYFSKRLRKGAGVFFTSDFLMTTTH